MRVFTWLSSLLGKRESVHNTWMQWTNSAYCREMRRRLAYYDNTQFKQNLVAFDSDGSPASPADWNAGWSGYGWDDIRAMLPDATEQQAVAPDSAPLVSIIVDNQAVAYSLPVESRKIVIDGQDDDANTKLTNDIYNGASFNVKADQHCKRTMLFDTNFQWFGWDETYMRIQPRNLAPYQVMALPSKAAPGDLQHPDCVVAVLQQTESLGGDLPQVDDDGAVWQVWKDDRYWYEKATEGRFQDPGCTIEGTNENPYKDPLTGRPVKPILVSHSEPCDDIHLWKADNLVMAAQRQDRNLTGLSFSQETQSFAIPQINGMRPEEIREQPWSPAAAFVVDSPEPGAGLTFKHPLLPLGEVSNVTIRQNRMKAALFGIDPDLVDPDKKVSSGVSVAQSRLALRELRDKQFPQWVPYEREAYWIISIIWNTHVETPRLQNIPRYDSPAASNRSFVEVVFGELDPIVDPLADVFEKKARIELGLNTAAEFIAQERRIPLERAKELHKDIHEYNQKFVPQDTQKQSTFGSFQRTGQSGNRPLNPDKPSEKGSTTAASGNNTIVQPNKVAKKAGA